MIKKIPEKNLIGNYVISGLNVEVYWRNGTGGEFSFRPDKGLPEIVLGINEVLWESMIAVVLHEALEFAMTDASVRYTRDDDFGNAHDGYVFWLTHPQFSDICGRVAGFLCDVIPELAKIWKVQNKGVK